MGTHEHKHQAPKKVTIGIVILSTTRVLADDKSGHWIREQATREGHEIVHHQVIPDDAETIKATIKEVVQKQAPQVLLLSGGTGITPKDVTIEAVHSMLEKELSAFGPLFAQLSYEEIGSAAIMSRATAGVFKNTALFCLPGSLNACKLACTKLIFPELGHLVKHMHD